MFRNLCIQLVVFICFCLYAVDILIKGRDTHANHSGYRQKTITVPWNYTYKLEEMNKMIMEISGDESKKKTFSGYLGECWQYAMKNSDTNLKTAQKPKRYKKDKDDNEE